MHLEIKKELAFLEKQKEMLLECDKFCEDLQRVVDQLSDQPAARLTVSGNSIGKIGNLMVFLYPKAMEEVTKILREIGKLGWRLHGEPEDYVEMRAKTWEFFKKGTVAKLAVRAFFPSEGDEGAVCYFKKVGTETKDKFELVCEGDN